MIAQRRIKGKRIPTGSSLLKAIRLEIDRQARMFNVSKSFVIATALAHAFGVKEQEDYKVASKKK